jgi:hypothetical protein
MPVCAVVGKSAWPVGLGEPGVALEPDLFGDPVISEVEGSLGDYEHPPAPQPTDQQAMSSLSCHDLRGLIQINLISGFENARSDPEPVPQADA